MLSNLFSILIRPNATLDRLIAERRNGQSWGATWFLIVLNMLLLFVVGVFAIRKVNDGIAAYRALSPTFETDLGPTVILWIAIGALVLVMIATIVDYILSRFVFSWLVIWGLRMVAGLQYPRDPEERREKARLLRLIHPYTLWINQIATLLTLLLLPFLLNMLSVQDVMQAIMMGTDEPPTSTMKWVVVMIIFAGVMGLITFLMWIYMIVVRVFAVQKIYNVSGAKAFWGPFLAYFIVNAVYQVINFVLQLLPAILHASTGGNSGPISF